MEFTDQIKAIAARLPVLLDSIQTEEATKQYLIIPFIQALGYDVFDPREVFPEFDANVGASKKYKLDYAILKDGKPIILIECKAKGDKLDKDSWSQLFHYFVATNARIGVLTNGTVYKFFTDLDKPNKMDDHPFLEIDLQDLKEPLIDELRKITKASFNLEEMVSAATELKYVGGIVQILTEQLSSPSEEFTKFFFAQLCPGRIFTPNAKLQFASYTQRALNQFVRDRLSYLLDDSSLQAHPIEPVKVKGQDPIEAVEGVVTTEEELEGYHIVKSILRETVDLKRVAYRDVQSYFGILFDDNNRKPICRLYFNNPKSKRIGLFECGGDEKQEEKVNIDSLNDIYKYADRLKATVEYYTRKPELEIKLEQAA
ncbi:type I restriction enzyme HsdR N-terminal domain-containing protein [Pseudanabaenaceae cyanobacterium LEGE 13415]|nr:type I restriction enzyme HsdR N-terminal domain-containing protein [Pseudanabaenaceae cyanobacterium LEGE 13415]